MYLGQLTSTLQAIPDGADGTRYTLNLMADIARKYKTDMSVFTKTRELIAGLQQKDWPGEARKIQRFVRDHIRYVKDVRGVETVQTPDITLKIKAGDCDDKSTLVATMLESIGHPVRFVAIGFRPDDYVHVFPETLIGKKWVSLETTEPVDIGWKPDNVVARMIVNV